MNLNVIRIFAIVVVEKLWTNKFLTFILIPFNVISEWIHSTVFNAFYRPIPPNYK